MMSWSGLKETQEKEMYDLFRSDRLIQDIISQYETSQGKNDRVQPRRKLKTS